MKKLLLLFAVMLSAVGAWAQNLWTLKSPVTTITSGKYVLVGMCSHGTGPCYYNSAEAGNRLYRLDKSKSEVTTGSLIESSYVWDVELLSDGKITVKWADDNNKFFIKDLEKNKNFQGTDMAQLISEIRTIDGKDYIALTLEDTNIGYIHANAPEGNPNLSYWNAYGDDGTAVKFTFYPVEQATTVAVTYSYKFDGVIKASEEVEAPIGGSFPAGSTLPDYVAAVWPEGTVVVTDAGKTFEVECNSALPFEVSTDYATAHWYALKIRDVDFTYLSYDSSKEYIPASASAYSIKNQDNYMWAFIGNPFDGFKVINKAAGDAKILSAPSAPTGDRNADQLARMVEETGVAGGNIAWNLKVPTHSNPVANVFYIEHPTATSYAFNRQSFNNENALCYWNGRDTGSAMLVEEAYDFSQFGDILFNGEEMQDGKIYRIQSSTRKTFTGIDGYTCNMKNQEGDANNPGQLWKYVVDGDKAYLQNVYAGLYPQKVASGPENTTQIGTDKSKAFTYAINNAETDAYVWNIYIGGEQINVESNGNVNYWFGDNAHHHIYEVELSDDDLTTMCMNWYNANPFDASANGYKKIDIIEGAVVISPSEFAAPSVINEQIDGLTIAEDATQEKVHTLFSNLNALAPYKNAVASYGDLQSVDYTPKAEWGTIILPINWANPDGWERYSCSAIEGDVLTLSVFAGGTKNKPMIIKVNEDKQNKIHQFIGYSNGAATTNQTDGLLTGVLEDNTKVPAGSFVLARQKSTGKIGFFPVAEGADYGLEKFKCYLTLPVESARYNALFFEGGETAIENVDGAESAAKAVVYDLAGRRVQNAQKGVFIVNGKVVIK